MQITENRSGFAMNQIHATKEKGIKILSKSERLSWTKKENCISKQLKRKSIKK